MSREFLQCMPFFAGRGIEPQNSAVASHSLKWFRDLISRALFWLRHFCDRGNGRVRARTAEPFPFASPLPRPLTTIASCSSLLRRTVQASRHATLNTETHQHHTARSANPSPDQIIPRLLSGSTSTQELSSFLLQAARRNPGRIGRMVPILSSSHHRLTQKPPSIRHRGIRRPDQAHALEARSRKIPPSPHRPYLLESQQTYSRLVVGGGGHPCYE